MPPEDQADAADRELYSSFVKTLGQRIRDLRKGRGWTLRDMVVEHGYHLSQWQGFESGRTGMSIPSLLRVARTFAIHPSALIAEIEVMLPDVNVRPADSDMLKPRPKPAPKTGPRAGTSPERKRPNG